MMDYGDGGWWVMMWISMAIFWGLVIFGVVALVNGFGDRGTRPESPGETLDRRLAAGEIDETQYRALRDELHRSLQGPVARAH